MQTTASQSIHLDRVETAYLNNRFLFIENTQSFSAGPYASLYPDSIAVENFEAATELLSKGEFYPELIVANIPLNYGALISFKIWLSNQLVRIPIIYNEVVLEEGMAPKLYRQKLVDDIINLPVFYNILPSKANFFNRMFNDKSVQRNEMVGEKRTVGQVLMRVIDLLVTSVCIILLAPIFILIAVIIKLESKGPAIYSSPRAGKGFRVFNFYKFRSMVAHADKMVEDLQQHNMYKEDANAPAFFKVKDDPRITRFGRFLRNSSLDELPQLFNVLLGDMSIVGNRPLPLYEAVSLTTDEWAERFMAPAGITGLWQISKRGKDDMSSEERISLDINYARNRSISGDFKIILKTPSALFQKTNV